MDVGGAVAVGVDDIGADGADPVGLGQLAAVGIDIVCADGEADLVDGERGGAVGMEREVARVLRLALNRRRRLRLERSCRLIVIDVVYENFVQT